MYFWILSCFTCLFIVPEASAFEIEQAMIQDLEVVKYSFSNKYAPFSWKQEYFGWSVEGAFEKAKRRILNEKPSTSKEYHRIFKEFLNSTRDFHVKCGFYATEVSFFPIEVKEVEGHYYVSSIPEDNPVSVSDGFFEPDPFDEHLCSENLSKISPGDELIAFNGVKIGDVIDQLVIDEFSGEKTATNTSLALRMLFRRLASQGNTVPVGNFQMSLVNHATLETYTCTLPWVHVPEWVTDPIAKKQTSSLEKFVGKDYSVALAKDLLKPLPLKKLALSEEEDARIKGFLPPLGRVIWESDPEQSLYAYIYENTEGKKVGYLYLPTFYYMGDEADQVIDEMQEIIHEFEKNADALVFDITNNGGGLDLFTYACLSMLTDKPLKTIPEYELLTQEDVYDAAIIYNELTQYFSLDSRENLQPATLSGYPTSDAFFEQVQKSAKDKLTTWQGGKRMTGLNYFIEDILPHPNVNFTKPILVLINELDFSCADFFPAILQDNNRATLFGKTTAGAGGYVKSYPHLSLFGVAKYSLTGSIAYRINGSPIENLGVTPDVPYDITKADLLDDYSGYSRAVNQTIRELIQ